MELPDDACECEAKMKGTGKQDFPGFGKEVAVASGWEKLCPPQRDSKATIVQVKKGDCPGQNDLDGKPVCHYTKEVPAPPKEVYTPAMCAKACTDTKPDTDGY